MTFEFSFLLSAGSRNVIGSAARRLLHPRSARDNSVSPNSRAISCFDSLLCVPKMSDSGSSLREPTPAAVMRRAPRQCTTLQVGLLRPHDRSQREPSAAPDQRVVSIRAIFAVEIRSLSRRLGGILSPAATLI